MKFYERQQAIHLRKQGYSIGTIANKLSVSKSSISIWTRSVQLTVEQINILSSNGFTTEAIELRRKNRLKNEQLKRQALISEASNQINKITKRELWFIGVMLYWAEGGKTQRMVRFSNGDPNMIKIMIKFFTLICKVPSTKLRGYIHIHPHLDVKTAENYWSKVSGIPLDQFYNTYNKINVSSKNTRDTLPYGVLDIYILDVQLFLKITGWAEGIFKAKIQ